MNQLSVTLGLLAMVLPGAAHAQDPVPAGKGAQDPASGGATEVEGQGKFATAKDKPTDEESTDATELDLSAGGIFSTGNSRNLAATGAGNFRLRRGIHQASSTVAGNYGRSAADKNADWQTTVGNVQGMARYDVFMHKHVAAFLMTTMRHDRFQGLEFRFNVDPGFAFYTLTKKKHRQWFEVGYDFQYDLRTDEAIIERDDNGDPVLDMDGETIQIVDQQQINHAARIFVGYSNRLSEAVTFDTGLEYLQSVIRGTRIRLNYNAALAVQLRKRFALATTFTLRYEHEPLPDIEPLDTITSLSLVYRLI